MIQKLRHKSLITELSITNVFKETKVMKRLIIIHHTGTLGGGTKSLIDTADMLMDEYEVIVCIPKGDPGFIDLLLKKSIHTVELNTYIPFLSDYSGRPPLISKSTLNSILSLFNIKKFCNEILKFEPDIVIFNSIVTSISAKYLPSNITKICIDRETMVHRTSINRYRQIFNKYVDGVAFISEYESSKFNLNNLTTTIIPDSVPLGAVLIENIETSRRKCNIPLKKFVILYMGGSSFIKGTDIILKAVNSLNDDYHLIVAGNFNKKSISIKSIFKHLIYPCFAYRQIILRREYLKSIRRKNVSFVGNVTEISGLMNAADVVVFPSFNVHQPRPCIEAGYYGKPVILSDYSETKEFFKDGYNALTFKPRKYKELVKKIVYAKSNPDEMKRIGKENRRMSLEKHNFSEIKASLHQFIIDVSANKQNIN